MSNENKGLASADEETKERVAKVGGSAEHSERGLQAADEETRERVARAGGESHGSRGSSGSSNEKKSEAGGKGGERELQPLTFSFCNLPRHQLSYNLMHFFDTLICFKESSILSNHFINGYHHFRKLF